MYIIEKIIKLLQKHNQRNSNVYLPKNEDTTELEDVITCNHNFMPIDSTGEILACSKCGYLITKKRLNKNRNIFKDY